MAEQYTALSADTFCEQPPSRDCAMSDEMLSFRVTHRKDLHRIVIPLTATVLDLHKELERLTGIPVEMQKIMYKGGMKDKSKTLTDMGVKDGIKMMLMGSKPAEVEALAAAGKAASAEPLLQHLKETATQVPLCDEQVHKRILDKGIPADAEQGLVGTESALPGAIKGLLDGGGSKVRLVFKASEGVMNIATSERTATYPLGAFPDATSHPITGHDGYKILGVKMGKTDASIRYFYWVPSQYVNAIIAALTGQVSLEGAGVASATLEDEMLQEAIRRSMTD